jgi:Zn-dependent protease with chaperone function
MLTGPLAIHFLDGQSTQLRPAWLHLENGSLRVSGEGFEKDYDLAQIAWPENMGQTVLTAHLPDGAAFQSISVAEWEAWLQSNGIRAGWVAKAQISKRWTIAAVLGFVLVVLGIWRWGIDWAADAAVILTPESVDVAVGASTLSYLDKSLLSPSKITQAERDKVQALFQEVAGAAQRKHVEGQAQTTPAQPAYTLHFRSMRFGPNAFALPGGTVVMTDEMVTLLDGAPDAMLGVLGHELGHVLHRHGMKMVYKSAAIALLSDFVLGDFSTVLATLPALLVQADYSRGAERQADQVAADLLTATGRSPAAMVVLFDRLSTHFREANGDDTERENPLGIAFSSHPSDKERIDFFKKMAAASGQ